MKVKDMLLKVNIKLNKLYELESTDTKITGMFVLPDLPTTEEISKELYKEVVETGYWVYSMVGHSGNFFFINYCSREAAEEDVRESKNNIMLYDVHILEL